MSKKFDITIIGGSFSGMAAALAMSNISPELKIAVIEKHDIINNDRMPDGRAYAISANSMKFFEEINIADEVLENAGKISDIKITDYKSPFFLDFLSAEVGAKDFGHIIESYHVHNALRNEMVKRPNITLYCPDSYVEIEFADGVDKEDEVPKEFESSVHEDSMSAYLLHGDHSPNLGALVKLDDSRILNSKLLFACDGRFSSLREQYQIPTAQKKYYQTAIVFNIKHKKPHKNIAHEKFLPGGPLAILPLQDPHHCSIVWIAKDEEAKAILELDEENFTHQLMKKMESCLGKVEVVSEKFSYLLILVEAQKFYHEKMLLIGDAAVGVHPIAGQGFNLAVVGIKILQNLIKEKLFSGLDIGSVSLIESYNKQAGFEAKKMIIATDVLNSLFETKSLSVSVARDLGLGVVGRFKSLKKFFIKGAGGI
ncbi:MAG: FAD-dependent monooxygenase [Rickettsiales bacterium]|nr:FAD-dependent monooxygenase [Rickettsiales bacterium]